MAGTWVDVGLKNRLYENVEETELTVALAAAENSFITEAEGHRRFYGVADWITLPDPGDVHGLHDDRHGNLIAVTSNGRVFRIDQDGNAEDLTMAPVAGQGPPIFAKTPDGLMIAAGTQVIRLGAAKTEVLAEDVPDKVSHVQFIDGYVLVNDAGTFQHSAAGDFVSWDPLDIFAAASKPDLVTAILVTPFNEIMICGPDSIEQYERLTSGETPFFRRWSVGEGLSAPYALLHADNAMFFANDKREIVRSSGQTSQPVSVDIGRVIEAPGLDWTGAWIGGFPDEPLHFDGQKFVLLQLPEAATPYGTKGLTYVFDYRQQRWSSLYGWDEALGVPTRWPGWSYWPLHGEVYVGGPGGQIGKLSKTVHSNWGVTQRMLIRTGYLSALGEVSIDNLRMRLRRGTGTNEAESLLRIRVRRDNGPWGRWVTKGLGKAGDRHMTVEFGRQGQGHVFQFEIQVTDDVPVEVHKLEAQVRRIGY